MSPFADLVVYGPDGKIVLIVESKNRTGTSRAWATQTRSNMFAHGTIPDSVFLLLALPDCFYLWKDAGTAPEPVEPSYELDAKPFLQPYYDKSNLSPDDIGSYSFDLLVTSWINELINWGISAEVPIETRKLLEESGLREALEGAKVVVQIPA